MSERCKHPQCGEPLSVKQAASGRGFCARHSGGGEPAAVVAGLREIVASPEGGAPKKRRAQVSKQAGIRANLKVTDSSQSKSVNVGVRLAPREAEWLANLARARLATMSSLAREAILAYLVKEDACG